MTETTLLWISNLLGAKRLLLLVLAVILTASVRFERVLSDALLVSVDLGRFQEHVNDGRGHSRCDTASNGRASESGHPQSRFIDMIHDVAAYPFARNPTDFRLQIAFERRPDKPSAFLYTDEDVQLILRALYTMEGFLAQPLWSGSYGAQHFIGTASCMVQMGRPALEVSGALLHAMYLQEWTHHLPRAFKCLKSTCNDICAVRRFLASLLGSKLETKLWRTTGIHGTGPWSSWIETQRKLRLAQRNPVAHNISKQTLHRLNTFLDTSDVRLLLCDEIEEFVGGDMVLGGNWKRRSPEHWDHVADLADILGEPKLVKWARFAQQMAVTLHSPQPILAFKELTPPNMAALWASESFNPNADPMEVERLQMFSQRSRHEQMLMKPYGHPDCAGTTCDLVNAHRELCDEFVINNSSIVEYLDQVDSFDQLLLQCENENSYPPREMPKLVPEEFRLWVDQDP